MKINDKVTFAGYDGTVVEVLPIEMGQNFARCVVDFGETTRIVRSMDLMRSSRAEIKDDNK